MAANPNWEKDCLAWYVQNKELYNAWRIIKIVLMLFHNAFVFG